MDDFVVNFAPSSAATPSAKNGSSIGGSAKKGGRWTDRVRDKRSREGMARKQARGGNAAVPNTNAGPSAATGGGGGGGGGGEDTVLGKRSRDEPVDASVSTARPRPAPSSSAPVASTSSSAGINKTVVGPGGKKQFISSLFTAEGLPAASGSSAPVIPARPSNAPLRAIPVVTPAVVEEDEEEVKEEIVKPSPAPALTALGLLPEIVSHLAGKMNISGPTACQAGAIPPLLAGTILSPSSSHRLPVLNPDQQRARDAILQAQTGSGKTLAFLLPIIQDLLTLSPSVLNGEAPSRSIGTLALILAPTRELAAQIYAVLESILSLPSSSGATTDFTFPPRALTPCLLVGGANRTHEKSRLRKGCPIVVATPGRLLDHLRTTECFRMAGEPIATKGPRGRLAVPGTGANYGALGRDRNAESRGRPLGLRWLVVDECDRLMDLGFEEQMKGVLEELERRSPSATLTNEEGKRRTVLCSATASEGVDLLAGMALHNPVTLTASTKKGTTITTAAPATTTSTSALTTTDAPTMTTEIDFTPPTQLVHNYIICPPKLRFVSLIALIRRTLSTAANKKGPGSKVLVFLSCTDAVDFYWEAMGSMGMGSNPIAVVNNDVHLSAKERSEKAKADAAAELKRYASHSPLLPGIPIYRLHGSLELANRLGSLAAFSKKSLVKGGKEEGKETENAVLLCTSVAARGLDVPFVSHVIQYDLPTEGGVTEYIHRVGRTARAGASGQATSFLLPTETTWIPWVETGMKSGVDKRNGVKDVKLREVGVEDILKDGFGGVGREYETRVTDVQMGFERWVSENDSNSTLARNAFASHIRAYATHPSSEKSMFNTKSLHLGHLAKSFGMREAPGASSNGKGKKAKSTGRVSLVRPIGRTISTKEAAERAIASLPARQSHHSQSRTSNAAGEFTTGRRHDEERAMVRQKEKVMRGPTGEGGSEFQIASSAMLESLAKSQSQVGGKRKR